MAAPSLYRRHRPRTFADVVGQEHVVRTLRNAVERGRVHHAYLFVGSRGTGKTSMAKILAACLNCERGPTVEPDGTCESCRAIASATSLDVIEMDAASNNSVDDIRELRESVAYAPVSGRHKVYILDEAHMLSSQAWNAFLKTLEEPPPNTIFVLATTEAQKVLPTVVDRCHRFDFTRPGVLEVATVLERVAQKEGMEVPEAAIRLIARSATGSFRDALGTLEQLTTYAGDGQIELDDVLAVLGVASAELLHQAVEAVAAGNPRAALATAAAVAAAGRDPSQFLRDLEGHVRDLLVVQLVGEVPPEVRLSPDRDDDLAAQAARLSRPEVVRLLDGLAAAQQHVRDGAEGRTQLELALVRAASPEVDVSTRALLARIDRLEARLGDSSPHAGPSPSPPSLPSPSPSGVPAPLPPAAAPPPPPAAVVEPSPPRAAAEPAPDATPPAPPHEPEPEPEFDPAPGAGPSSPAPADLVSLAGLWPAVVDAVRPENAMLAALIEGARPVELVDSELVVAFPPDADFLKRKAEADEPRRLVAGALSSVAGRRLGLRYELRAPKPGAPGGEDGPPEVAPEEWVRRIVAEFDAEEISSDDSPKEKDA